MTFSQAKNCTDWNGLLSRLVDDGEQAMPSAGDNGWEWVIVGHNASHQFSIGHDRDFTQFAVRSCGESGKCDDQGFEITETHIYRHSPTLSETMKGSYLGHY